MIKIRTSYNANRRETCPRKNLTVSETKFVLIFQRKIGSRRTLFSDDFVKSTQRINIGDKFYRKQIRMCICYFEIRFTEDK